MSDLVRDGHFGSTVQAALETYDQLPDNLSRCLRFFNDFEADVAEEELRLARSLLCQMILVVYRDSKRRDPAIAQDFAFAFVRDYPGMAGSALLPRWSSLADASFAFQMVVHSSNRLLVWQQSSRLVLAANEFLDGLIGLMIVAWRCALGKPVNPKVLANAYGSKIKEFADLTGGDDGPFYLVLRVADADLRNGLAHGSAWLDPKEDRIRYMVGRQQKAEREIGLIEFMTKAALGSHMASSYAAALATIAVWESGRTGSRQALPTRLFELLSFEVS
jgi:hypothetical protein